MVEFAEKSRIPPEAELLARARRRDPQAVRLIIQQHNQRLYRLARSIVRNDSEAEDVVQEAYCNAFANLAGFRGEARLGTWLARIVVNDTLGFLRRRRPMVEFDAASENLKLAAAIIPFPMARSQMDPEATVAQRQVQALLERAIDALPEAFRTILVARVIEGMSVEETAALVGIPPATVKTRLHRARRLLRREMEQHIGPILGGAFPFAGRRCQRLTEKVLARLDLA